MARGKKAAADAGPVDEPWELPEGWRWERLNAVSSAPASGSPSSRFADEFRYLDVSGIDGSKLAPRVVATADGPSRARQFVQSGDTVLSGVRVYLRNFALIPDDMVDVASTAFCVVRPGPALLPRYMHYWIGSDWFINSLLPLQRGNSPPAVLDGDVRGQPIPVPPLDVQRAIVSRVDQLFAEIDEGETALIEARAGVETYRKSLLKAAVRGELTADWRRQNPPRQTGAELLRRILAERRARWEADPKNARKRYVEPTGPDTDGLPGLPDGWTWAGLDQLSTHDVRNGLSIKDTPVPTEVRALRLGALADPAVNWSVFRYLPIARAAATPYRLENGDLLVSRANGSPHLVGKASLCVDPPSDMIFPDTAIRYRLLGDPALRGWLVIAWASPLVRGQISKRAKTTAGILKISQDDIGRIAVPLASVDEVCKANQLISAVQWDIEGNDLLDLAIAPATLRQSILAAAFRGELTT